MLRKAKLPKNGSCETILEIWHTDADYQKSLSDEGWTDEKIEEYYAALTLEDHSCEATPQERGRWQGNWKIVVNWEGVHGPIRQRPDSVKRSTPIVDGTKNILKVLDKETSQSIQRNKEDEIFDTNLKVTRSTPSRFTLELDGDIIFQQVPLHPRSGSRTMNGSQTKVGIIGDLQPGLNSKIFKIEIRTGKLVAPRQEVIPTKYVLVFGCCFSIAGNFNSQAVDGCVWTEHLHTLHVQTQTLCQHVTLHSFLAPHLWLNGSSCAFHQKYFPILSFCLARHVVWPAQHAFFVVVYPPFFNLTHSFWLMLNVVSTENLRRSTRP